MVERDKQKEMCHTKNKWIYSKYKSTTPVRQSSFRFPTTGKEFQIQHFTLYYEDFVAS